MNLPYLDWPPPYTIKTSARSKRISIRISAYKGLEIIIPKRTSQQRAIEFLTLKYDWVQKHRHLLQPKLAVHSILPDVVHLKTVGETWSVKYGQSISKKIFASEATHTLLLRDDHHETCLATLKKWLQGKALTHLSDLTKQCSEKYHLSYASIRVRYQRSRWGSCSRDKNINLNCKLMLLPWELTHYIIVHELIHTIHFDHSERFWTAVEEFIPNHIQLRSRLKNIDQELPNWLYY